MHLEIAGRLEGIRVMNDHWLRLIRGPTDSEHVETGGLTEEAVPLHKVNGEAREPFLLGGINRFGRSIDLVGLCRANFDKDEAAAIEGDQVELAEGTGEVAGEDAPALTSEEASCGPLRA
jgi:hypothetical protein